MSEVPLWALSPGQSFTPDPQGAQSMQPKIQPLTKRRGLDGGVRRGSATLTILSGVWQRQRLGCCTLEIAQGQILSQSHTDAIRFWWHLQLTKETINLPLGRLQGGVTPRGRCGKRRGPRPHTCAIAADSVPPGAPRFKGSDQHRHFAGPRVSPHRRAWLDGTLQVAADQDQLDVEV